MGMGDVTLTDFLLSYNLLSQESFPKPPIIISIQIEETLTFAHLIARKLRQHDERVIVHPSVISLKKALALAEKKHAKSIVFLGQREHQKETFEAKNMKTKKSESFNETSAFLEWLESND